MRFFLTLLFFFTGFSSAVTTSQEVLYNLSIQKSSETVRQTVPFSLASDGFLQQFQFTSEDGKLYNVQFTADFFKTVLGFYPPPGPERPCLAVPAGLVKCRDLVYQPVSTPDVICTTKLIDSYSHLYITRLQDNVTSEAFDDPDYCWRYYGGKSVAPYYKYGDNVVSRSILGRFLYVLNDRKPTLDILRNWGLTVALDGTAVSGDFGAGDFDPAKTYAPGSTAGGGAGAGSGAGAGGGTAGPPVPPVDPNDPFKPGSQSACAGKFSNLSWFEGALAKWFMPCRDWQADITALKDKAVLSAPLGFLKWLPPNEDQNHAIACARLTFAVQIMYETAVVTPMCSTVGQAYLSYIRPLFAYILYAALVAFMFRTVMR
jgi:hypothetical protein